MHFRNYVGVSIRDLSQTKKELLNVDILKKKIVGAVFILFIHSRT